MLSWELPLPIVDPNCEWPIDFYVNGIVGELIRCTATRCTFTCSSDDPNDTLLGHYSEMSRHWKTVIASSPDQAEVLWNLEHAILRQMWTQKICLVEMRPFQENCPARVKLNHINYHHPEYTTKSGFLRLVRQYSSRFPTDSEDDLQYQQECFLLSFEKARFTLTGLWRRRLNRFINGKPEVDVTYEVLRWLLVQHGPIPNYPTSPITFLIDEEKFKWTQDMLPYTKGEYEADRQWLQEAYRQGYT